jgi:8-oxo-dGTP pyrophosphatase MutT (NUDIX family)
MMATDLRQRLADAAGRAGPPSSDYDLNRDVTLPKNRKLRPAGVLVGISPVSGRVEVILTKRSSRLKHHPGQIAFPGGKVDATDATPVDAALREANEEIGLPLGAVEVLGSLPPHETVTGFSVTPVLGLIHEAFAPVPEMGEVEEVFSAPLAHVLDSTNFLVESRFWRGNLRHYYVVPWGPYYIWGATARILRGLADRMAE